MAHLVKKIVKGHAYWYARECRRVGRRVVTAWQRYLGTADHIIARAAAPEPPASLHIAHAGHVAALYGAAQYVGMVDIINRLAPKRAQGAAPGQFLLVAAINRICAPCGKVAIPAWLAKTPLPRWLGHPPETFDSQAFWNHMQRLTPAAMRATEQELTAFVVREFDLPLRTVLFDETNYYTFIHSFNERCALPQRGHNKQKRTDLRQVGLALLADATYQLPLFHEVYEGNRPDAKEFGSVVEEMARRLRTLRDSCEGITIIMDKGQNSADNLAALSAHNHVHFIGALVPTQHEDLLAVPLRQYKVYEGREGWHAYRTQRDVFGALRTVVVTHNVAFQDAQTQCLWREIGKARAALFALGRQLRQWHGRGIKPTIASVSSRATLILRSRHMKDLFSTRVYETTAGVRFTFSFDHRAADHLAHALFGKTILFTDQHAWDTTDIVESYHSQQRIEDMFRVTKNGGGVAWFPMFHWTDHNIRVHAFYCMLALLLRGVILRTLRTAGISMTPERALEHLEDITEVAQIYPDGRALITTNSVTPIQRTLYELFKLDRWMAPLLGTTRL